MPKIVKFYGCIQLLKNESWPPLIWPTLYNCATHYKIGPLVYDDINFSLEL